MDEREVDYLRQQIRDLEQARSRWRALAIVSLAALALLVALGGGAMLVVGAGMTQRMRLEAARARDAELQAREALEQARRAELLARQRAEEAAQKAQQARQAAEQGQQ